MSKTIPNQRCSILTLIVLIFLRTNLCLTFDWTESMEELFPILLPLSDEIQSAVGVPKKINTDETKGILELLEMASDLYPKKKKPMDDVDVETILRKILEDNVIKRRVQKILRGMKETPRKEKLGDSARDWGLAVRPMIRYPVRRVKPKPPKANIHRLISDMLRSAEKETPKEKSAKKNKELLKTTTTESYERKRVKDFFKILGQMKDMGITILQMDRLSKEPGKYRGFSESLDEREIGAEMDKLAEDGLPLEARMAEEVDEEHEDVEKLKAVLEEDNSGEVKKGLEKLVSAIDCLY